MSRLVDPGTRPLILALAILIGACSAELPPEESLARAEAALTAGDRQGALIDARSILQQQPDNPSARRIIGEIELWRQNPGAAVDSFKRGLETSDDPGLLSLYAEALVRAGDLETFDLLVLEDYFAAAEETPTYLAALAKARAAQGDLREAQRTLALALQDSPENLALRLADAEITAAEGDNDLALKSLEGVFINHPESAQAWALRGELEMRRGGFPAAIEALEKATAINPNRQTDKILLASALLKNRDLQRARKLIETLADQFPQSAGVNLVLAELLYREGDIAQALVSINTAVSLAPRLPVALYLAGMINSAAGNLEAARRNLITFLGFQPEQMDARERLASVHLALNEPDEAVESARIILEKYPMNIAATRTLALALAMLGDQAGSVEAFGRAFELDPASNDAAASYGAVLARSGDLDGAITQLRLARDLDPESLEMWTRLTAALMANGDTAGATAEADAFIQAYPNTPQAHALAGSVARSTGNLASAREHFEDAVSLNPSDVAGNVGLAALAIEDGDTQLAEQHYQNILAAQPNHLQTLLRMAQLSEASGDLTAMESRLETASTKNPEALQPRIALARYRLSRGLAQDAVNLLEPVKNNYPKDLALHELLLKSYLALGDYSSARFESKLLVELAPNNADALALQALSESGAGRLASAEESLRAATKLSDSAQISGQLINVLLQRGKFQEAREVLDNIPAKNLSDWQISFARGQIAEAEGELKDAAAHYASAMEAAPQARTLIARSNVLSRDGKQVSAIAELNAWLDDNPDDANVLRLLGSLQLQMGNEKAAFPNFEKLNTLQPDDAAILNNLAWTALSFDAAQGLKWAQEANKLAPENIEIQDTLSLAFAVNGDSDSALALSDQLLEQSPGNPAFVVTRARILAALGQKQQAIQLLDSLLARDGSLASARILRDELKTQ